MSTAGPSTTPLTRLGVWLLWLGLCAAAEADTLDEPAEPWLHQLLRAATTVAGAALLAQLLLPRRKPGRVTELPADPTLTLREDAGVAKVVPVHAGRARRAAGPMREGTTRDRDNYANPRRLSFLPPAPPPTATEDAADAPAAAAAAPAPTPLPRYTLAEVAQHCTEDDAWVIIDERVYDVTRFVDKHPGGVGPMLNLAGKDCTDVFANYHAARVYKTMLPGFLIGEVGPGEIEVWPHVADFRRVRQELLRRGLFETDMGYYRTMAAWTALLWLGGLYLSLCFEGCATRMLGAAVMGVFWQQLAGIGHDLGHSGVTHEFYKDHFLGSALSAFMGLSVGWWKSDHNTHHVVCNAIEHDPNIQHMPMLAITSKIFARAKFWDTYHRKWVGMDDVAHFLVSHQHLFFYPLMLVGRWNLYAQGLIYLIFQHDKTHFRKTELAGTAVYFTWVFAVALSMPTWAQTVGWVMVSHAVAGILHVQIVLSHWSMHSYEGRAYTGADDEWYITQLRTTMNVATDPLLDWTHIGLQFQVEHHLFPRLPRHNLRIAREMVREVVDKHFPTGSEESKRLFPLGAAYHEPGFFAGNVEMWHALKKAAYAARSAKKGEHGFWECALWDVVNCVG